MADCSKHCFEVADKTCEASILSLCSLFKLQRWPMWTETMFPLSTTSNSLLDCWSYAGVGRLKRFGEPFQPFYIGVLSHSHFLRFFLKNKSANLFAFLQNVV